MLLLYPARGNLWIWPMNTVVTALKSSKFLLALIALALFSLLVAQAFEYKLKINSAESISFDESGKMSTCRENAVKVLKLEKIDVTNLHQISDLCYTEIRREYLLGNYNIHRYNVIKQQFQTIIVMWMVVAITLSGVFLSGMQLLGAYRIASTGQGQLAESSDLSIERGKISLKSSVTGLMILSVSLAFFIVYVKWVYSLTPDSYTSEATSPSVISSLPGPQRLQILPGIGRPGSPPNNTSVPIENASQGTQNGPSLEKTQPTSAR